MGRQIQCDRKVCGHLTFTLICGPSSNYCHKVESTVLEMMALNVILQFSFCGTKMHENLPVHKTRSVKT